MSLNVGLKQKPTKFLGTVAILASTWGYTAKHKIQQAKLRKFHRVFLRSPPYPFSVIGPPDGVSSSGLGRSKTGTAATGHRHYVASEHKYQAAKVQSQALELIWT